MRILLLAPHPFYQNRGTPIAVKLLARSLSGSGHKVCILTYHEGNDISIPHVDIYRIPKVPGVSKIKPGPSIKKIICDFFLLFKCLYLLNRYKFDIIHAVEDSVFLALILKYFYHLPYVYDMDSSMPHQIIDKYLNLKPLKPALEYFEKIVIQNSIGIIAVCKYLENIAAKYDSHKPILRLEDISLLSEHSEPGQDLRKYHNIDGRIIMYVGNLEIYQGIDLLLKSFQRVLQNRKQVNLVIVGGTTEDIEKYQEKAKRFGIEQNTVFTGPRPISQLASLLGQADILVSPRIKGGNTPMKIYSYLDSGKPLIATRLYTHTQVLDDHIAVLVNLDSGSMSNGILSLLDNKNYCERLATQAKDRVKNEFSFNAYKRKLTDFYTNIEKRIIIMNKAGNGGE